MKKVVRRRKTWCPSPQRKIGIRVPEHVKLLVEKKAEEIIESEIKPKYFALISTVDCINRLSKVYSKWHRNYFYFCAEFVSSHPNAISPSFEARFVRMEYVGSEKFNLSYMRHTGQWWQV